MASYGEPQNTEYNINIKHSLLFYSIILDLFKKKYIYYIYFYVFAVL